MQLIFSRGPIIINVLIVILRYVLFYRRVGDKKKKKGAHAPADAVPAWLADCARLFSNPSPLPRPPRIFGLSSFIILPSPACNNTSLRVNASTTFNHI